MNPHKFKLGLMLSLTISGFLVSAFAQTTPTVQVTVSPATASLRPSATKDFGALVKNSTNQNVTWWINDIAGGNATVGTINADGLYTAPASRGALASVTVAAKSVAAPTASGTAVVTLLNPYPTIEALTPSAVNVGSLPVTISGKGFIPTSKLLIDGAPANVTYVSPTEMRFTATYSTPVKLGLVIMNPDPGAAASYSKSLTIMPPVALSLSPDTTNVRLFATKKFTATVSNSLNKTVVWTVNGVPGGNAALGTIDATGLYTAPTALPNPNQVTIKAVAAASAAATDQSVATILNPIPVLEATLPGVLPIRDASTFVITGTGFVPTSTAKLNNVVIGATYLSPTQLRITGNVPATVANMALLTVSNPDPGKSTSKTLVASTAVENPRVTALAASRFLEQASWGPSPAAIARVQQLGFDGWLQEQKTITPSDYVVANMSQEVCDLQSQFFVNALKGQDQLRQRMAFALHQIWVVSALKLNHAYEYAPYLRVLNKHALGNYRALMYDMTLNPAMGNYLDMVDNEKADPAKKIAPNENYAREVLQLFTIGLVQLNPDGSPRRDALGQTIPTYTQEDIIQFTNAFTGWTYPVKPGKIAKAHNPEFFDGPMAAWQPLHDTTAKTLFNGRILPPGQTADRDLNDALDNIFDHPNVAPFVCLRLIQSLVTSNPSPSYVSRIVGTYNGRGGSAKGDLFAVVRAILLDPEARVGDSNVSIGALRPDDPTRGKLRSPVLYLTNLLRTLDATVVVDNPIESFASDMGQKPFYPASVFSYYSPFSRVPQSPLAGPEFQLLTPTTALTRVNMVYSLLVDGLENEVKYSKAPFLQVAKDPAALVELVNKVLFYGRMPAEMKTSIATAVAADEDDNCRVEIALYLAATSGLYQVQN
ncbi:MAG TPA: hypothetical protein DEH78_21545 [Solibacterales bacterium]|nr:hypothetical protein [Bryobacterales bacterium]